MLIRRYLLICLTLLSAFSQTAYANTEARLALVIGNSNYKHSPLRNPVNDARLMAQSLQEAGFTVLKAENASLRDMRRLVRDFGEKLKANGGVGLFYFAGHGVQVRGENYLVSVDSDIRQEDEVAEDSLSTSLVLEKMQSASNRMNIVILDACRNNPFASNSRSAVSGLAAVSAPSGTLVAYSTSPGSVAFDGNGANSLYTKYLANAMREPGSRIEDVFKDVRAAVRKETGNKQTPWENTALEGQFYFKPAGAPVVLPTQANAKPSSADTSLDLAFWDSIKTSQRPADLQAYLVQFPNGIFASLAKNRLDEIGIAANKPAVKKISSSPTVAPALPADNSLGVMVLTDPYTGLKTKQAVTIIESTDGITAYSTGDEIAKDGNVIQARIGEASLKFVSGQFWSFPLKSGTSGEASVLRTDVSYKAPGSVRWSVTALDGGRMRIDAVVNYYFTLGTYAQKSYGKWTATYSDQRQLPDSFSTDLKGQSNSPVYGGDSKVAGTIEFR